jgi:3-oxoacyl-[acyl-carrier protein] reductase|tara:strand:+ start:642 stop:1412 length:771 start_codon:yes stop_codon:yes gene_type:complete
MGVAGRVAIVTGAGSGIGCGVANSLAEAGANVAIFDIDAEAGAVAAAAMNEMYGTGSASNYALDLTVPTAVDEAVTAVVGSLGSIDILVNNAGVITGPTNVEDLPERDWDWVVDTNIKSQFLTSRAVTPHMKRAGFGRIINIASRSWLGVAGRVHYSASKGAVISFTRSLAIELGEHGITANCVSPTLVVTPLFESTPKADRDNVMKRTRAQPIPRLGTVEDMAYAVLFFADEDADFITGQHIYVGGGADLMTATP